MSTFYFPPVEGAAIEPGSVANDKLADMAQSTIKGRAAGAGTGAPQDLTATQATAILNNMVGDSGSGGTKGLVPAPAAGDAAASKFLKADGTWSTAGGTGANTALSNLTTTSVNEDLIPSSNLKKLGNATTEWLRLTVQNVDFQKQATVPLTIATNGNSGFSYGGLTNVNGYIESVGNFDLAIFSDDDAVNNSDATGGIALITGNKTDGNGLSGDIKLTTGSSDGGASGVITLETGASDGTGQQAGALTLKTGAGTGSGSLSGDIDIYTSDTIDGQTGDISIHTGSPGDTSASSFVSGALTIKTGEAANVGGASGEIILGSGAATAQSGGLTLSTGNATEASGGSGYLQILTGTGDFSGNLDISTGPAIGGVSGNIQLITGANDSANQSGDISLLTGANTDTSNSGAIYIKTGVTDGAGTGEIYIQTGDTTTGSSSGQLSLFTGNSNSAQSGDVYLSTGNSSGANSGSIILQTGTNGAGSRGTVDATLGYLFLPPQATADPTGVTGAVYYNTSTNKLRVYNGTTWQDCN